MHFTMMSFYIVVTSRLTDVTCNQWAILHVRNRIFKNWFMLSVRISSSGCTREVWKAREKRKSCSRGATSSFLIALKTSQVHP